MRWNNWYGNGMVRNSWYDNGMVIIVDMVMV